MGPAPGPLIEGRTLSAACEQRGLLGVLRERDHGARAAVRVGHDVFHLL